MFSDFLQGARCTPNLSSTALLSKGIEGKGIATSYLHFIALHKKDRHVKHAGDFFGTLISRQTPRCEDLPCDKVIYSSDDPSDAGRPVWYAAAPRSPAAQQTKLSTPRSFLFRSAVWF